MCCLSAHSGFEVFPCRPRGKEPLTKHGYKDATRDEAQVRRWWTIWPDANIGLPTGEKNGIIAVDPDGEEGEKLLAELERRFGKLPPTVESATGRGRHLFFELPEGCWRVPCSKGDGLDIRGDGGHIIAPPSIHPSGKTYEWNETEKFAIAPRWLLDCARNWIATLRALDGPTAAEGGSAGGKVTGEGRPESPKGRENGERGASVAVFPDVQPVTEPWSEIGEARLRSALKAIPAVDRDSAWLKVGFSLHDLAKHDPRWPGRAIWDEWSRTCPEKFNAADQEKTWASFARDYDGPRVTVATIFHSAKDRGWVNPSSPFAAASDEPPITEPKATLDFSRRLRTDAGNALAFLDLFGDDLRFVEKWGCWIVWGSRRWVEKSDIAMLPLARRATEEMLKSAIAQPAASADREAWINHAVATQRDARLRAMINLAKGEPRVRIEPKALDADLWLLGCPNGTLDLRTGKLREARREDFITKQIGVAFDPAATCPCFRKFLDWLTQVDRELAAFLQAFVGYALTGEVCEEKMCVWFGDGDNGKSTLVMTLFDLLGDYAVKVRSDLLVHAQGKEGAPSPDVAALRGRRLAIVSETEDGCSLSEARIKDIVSNEVIAARRLHCDPFTFPPLTKSSCRPTIGRTSEEQTTAFGGGWRSCPSMRRSLRKRKSQTFERGSCAPSCPAS